jgi:hypothetical protein
MRFAILVVLSADEQGKGHHSRLPLSPFLLPSLHPSLPRQAAATQYTTSFLSSHYLNPESEFQRRKRGKQEGTRQVPVPSREQKKTN